jgi:hypothetical protein
LLLVKAPGCDVNEVNNKNGTPLADLFLNKFFGGLLASIVALGGCLFSPLFAFAPDGPEGNGGRYVVFIWYYTCVAFVLLVAYAVKPFIIFYLHFGVPASVWRKLQWRHEEEVDPSLHCQPRELSSGGHLAMASWKLGPCKLGVVVKAGCDVNQADKDGMTPAFAAAQNTATRPRSRCSSRRAATSTRRRRTERRRPTSLLRGARRPRSRSSSIMPRAAT